MFTDEGKVGKPIFCTALPPSLLRLLIHLVRLRIVNRGTLFVLAIVPDLGEDILGTVLTRTLWEHCADTT